jgi:uncharacterized protein (UPF0212 family)
MDHTKTEINAVEEALNVAAEAQVRELNDLQLAFVGGGIGEVAPL